MSKYVVVHYSEKELKNYSHYIGNLFINNNGVYNICNTEEDIMKSNQYFANVPIRIAIVHDDAQINIGDTILAECSNKKLDNRIFAIIDISDTGIVQMKDENGECVLSTKFMLECPLFIRWATDLENKLIVSNQSLEGFNKERYLEDLKNKFIPVIEKSGFFDLEKETNCNSTCHYPPTHIHIPKGKGYKHVCPSCKKETIIIPTQIMF